jgi:tRNA pseudouridine38-40 synthase
VLEEALRVPLAGPTAVVAAGRTDAGVHAAGQVVSLRTASATPTRGIVLGTNSALPPDVAVLTAEEVSPEFHARYSARGKHYRYRLVPGPVRPPLRGRYAAWCREELDIEAMSAAAGQLLGEHDFSSFRNVGSFAGSGVRNLRRLDITRDGPYISVDVVGDGFLYKMVRNLVGTLVLVGRGLLTPAAVRSILQEKDRRCAGPTAPPQGLCLMEVFY